MCLTLHLSTLNVVFLHAAHSPNFVRLSEVNLNNVISSANLDALQFFPSSRWFIEV